MTEYDDNLTNVSLLWPYLTTTSSCWYDTFLIIHFFFLTDASSSKPSLISSLDCLSSIVQRISTDTAVAPPGDSVVPRGPGSPQNSPAVSRPADEPNSIYEPLWTWRTRGLIFHKKTKPCFLHFKGGKYRCDIPVFYSKSQKCGLTTEVFYRLKYI